ncbi:YdcH family protein [Chelatococcus sp. GCM10030263]|jgi:hypothetical protein|uniref:YdcH family protein n=1 Tax=Chelatococcus sp. GCM10030263 TaxID=3273387 RepID=UPI003618122C
MSLEAHVMELKRRHQALEEEIQTTLACPSASPLKIAELKRKKLQLKDTLEQLKLGMASKSVH